MSRKSKVMTAAEAISKLVPDECDELAVGGMHMHNNPMALVRELIRQEKAFRRLVTSPSACINADLLIGAGMVEEIVSSYVGFEHLGLAPNFRRAAENGTIDILEVDEGLIVLALRAGGGGLPFVPLPRGLELADLHKVNPRYYRFVEDPYTGERVMTVPPLRPQVALVHCQLADPYGNAVFLGSSFTDREMIFAADVVILQVERVVTSDEISRHALNAVPGFLVAAVVEAPFGCHPTSSHGCYRHDEGALKEYLEAARDQSSFVDYLARYVHKLKGHREYLDLLGGEDALGWLREGETAR